MALLNIPSGTANSLTITVWLDPSKAAAPEGHCGGRLPEFKHGVGQAVHDDGTMRMCWSRRIRYFDSNSWGVSERSTHSTSAIGARYVDAVYPGRLAKTLASQSAKRNLDTPHQPALNGSEGVCVTTCLRQLRNAPAACTVQCLMSWLARSDC